VPPGKVKEENPKKQGTGTIAIATLNICIERGFAHNKRQVLDALDALLALSVIISQVVGIHRTAAFSKAFSLGNLGICFGSQQHQSGWCQFGGPTWESRRCPGPPGFLLEWL
jgi:hypothetical protein